MLTRKQIKRRMAQDTYYALLGSGSISGSEEQGKTFEYLIDLFIDEQGLPPTISGGCQCGCINLHWFSKSYSVIIDVFTSGRFVVYGSINSNELDYIFCDYLEELNGLSAGIIKSAIYMMEIEAEEEYA